MPQPAEAIDAQVRLISVFEDAWAELEAEELALLNEPTKFRRLARVRELEDMVQGMINALTDQAVAWANDEFADIYGWGAMSADADFAWTQPHLDALSQLANEFFNDVLQATQYVGKDTKRFVREVSRGRIEQMLVQGATPGRTAKDVATILRERGIAAITYKNGARVGLDTYSRMLVRTKSAQAYNIGTLTAAASKDVQWFEIIDGPECGLSFHEDGLRAAGMIVDRHTADKYYISHPNCRRSFAPRPDIVTKADAKKAEPFRTDAQNEDIRRADEARRQRALRGEARAQQRAAKARGVEKAAQRQAAVQAKHQAAAVERARVAEAAFREQVRADQAAIAQLEAQRQTAARAEARAKPVAPGTVTQTAAGRADAEARALLDLGHADDDTLRDFILANPERFTPVGRTVANSVNDVETFLDNEQGITLLIKRAAYIDNPEVRNEMFANDLLDGSGTLHSIIRPASPIDKNGQGYIVILHSEFDPRVNTLMFRSDAREALIQSATNAELGDDFIRSSIFDYGVENRDRHGGNWLIANTPDGPRVVLIDHGIIDPADKPFGTDLRLLKEFENVNAFFNIGAAGQRSAYTFERAATVAQEAAQHYLDRLPQAVLRYPERERAAIIEQAAERFGQFIRREGSGWERLSTRLSYLPGWSG